MERGGKEGRGKGREEEGGMKVVYLRILSHKGKFSRKTSNELFD